MDIQTGKTYGTRDEALAAGVPESDIAQIHRGANGEPRPSFARPAKVKFSKGSFKPVEVNER